MLREKLPQPGASEYRQDKLSRPFIARIWLYVAIFDLIYLWGVYLRFQLLLRRVVICDRYLNDTKLDFSLNFPHVEFQKMFVWRVLCFVALKPNAAFLLWIPVEESMRRSILKDEPFPDTEKTLNWRLSAYMDKRQFSEHDYLTLDCQRSADSIRSEIAQYIQRKMDRGSP
jgi:thymidylate kinase